MWVGRATVFLVGLAVILALAFALLTVGVRPAEAKTFTVTNTNDSGIGSLRQAITDANDAAGDDAITVTATGTINLQSELPRLFTNVEIGGPGADDLTLRRDTGGDYPVFTIQEADVTVSGLTVANGRGGCCNFGGIGIVDNTATHSVKLRGVVVTGNEAATGAGIYNAGNLALISSTVSGNTAVHGAGIRNDGALTLTNSTVSGNTATGDQSVPGMGGGILNYGTLALTHSTLSDNKASYGANLYTGLSTTATLTNTIMANPLVAPSSQGPGFGCGGGGTRTSQGNNLDEDSSCFEEPGSGDVLGQDPKLGPLQNNGGPTETRALLSGSPAIDAADNATCPVIDQRGAGRDDDGDDDGTRLCDIGAFELQVAPRVTGATPTGTGISRNTNIWATFSEKMNSATLTKSTFKLFKVNSDGTTTQITNVAVTPSTNGLRAKLDPYPLDPSKLLAANTRYKAVVTTGAKDLAGNALDQNPSIGGNQQKVWTFKTGTS